MTSRPLVWPALLLERPFDGTYGDGHLHDPSQIRGFFPDTTFLGDIRSFNWDGGSDLSTADTTATEGVFIDMSLGSGQWMGDFFIGGDFQLISGGAIYTDDPAGTTYIALSNAKAATIDFKSGGNDGSIVYSVGSFEFDAITQYQFVVGGTVRAILSATALSLTGPELRLGGSDIVASGSDADTFIRPATDQWSIHAGNVEMLRLTESTNDQVFLGNFGSTTVPSLSRIDDPDTGWSFQGSDVIGGIIGGTQRLIVDSTTRASGAFQSYVPTWTSTGTAPAIGNGSISGSYHKIGRLVTCHIFMQAGSTSTFGTGTYRWSLPVNCSSTFRAGGTAVVTDSGTAAYFASVEAVTATAVELLVVHNTAGGNVGQTNPFTWANGDSIRLTFTYEATA